MPHPQTERGPRPLAIFSPRIFGRLNVFSLLVYRFWDWVRPACRTPDGDFRDGRPFSRLRLLSLNVVSRGLEPGESVDPALIFNSYYRLESPGRPPLEGKASLQWIRCG